MTLEVDQEILQDFLVEVGEILEQLSEQLVDLESSPTDSALLNAIFRGFHTVKGGAGFLAFNNMVEICHSAENIFDALRNNKLLVTSDMMDIILKSLDAVNSMFAQIHAGETPSAADAELLAALELLLNGEPLKETLEEPLSSADLVQDTDEIPVIDTVSDNQPEEHVAKSVNETVADTVHSLDEISEDEFEVLLDSLHGAGGIPGQLDTESEEHVHTMTEPSEVNVSEVKTVQAHSPPLTASITSPSPEEKLTTKKTTDAVKVGDSIKTSTVPEKANAKPAQVKDNAKPAQTTAQLAETTVRVDTGRLDEIMNMVGELVLVRNRLVNLGASLAESSVSQAVSNLDVVTANLQMAVMKTRMQPIKKVFGRFPRVVRDLARSLKKEIVLELQGEDTDLDKNLVEELADPLIHLVRNSVDHGIELPDERESSGKPRVGTVLLSAEQAGDHILLSIKDDGSGMNPDKLRQLAVEKGLLEQDSADRLSDKECFNLIFMPGFSTKSQISDISGRGVGMDVVKTKINQLNGSVDINSVVGMGTELKIKVPLTLAILPTLMVILGDQTFALPLTNVNEIFHLDLKQTNVVDGQLMVVVREKAIPLFHLKQWLVHETCSDDDTSDSTTAHVVIVTVGTQRVAFVVDQLIGQEEVVIKPLGDMLQGTPGMAGATITGDGQMALILDIPSLLNRYV